MIATAEGSKAELQPLSITVRENRIRAIKTELDQLAQFTMRGGVGAISYRSQEHQRGQLLTVCCSNKLIFGDI